MLTPIGEHLVSIGNKHGDIFTLLEERTNKLMAHPHVIRFIQENPHVTREMIERAQVKVYDSIKEAIACRKCPGLNECPNLMKGHCALLQTNGKLIDVLYSPCEKYLAKFEQEQREKLIQAHYIPYETLNATFDSFVPNEENMNALKAAIHFSETVEPGKKGEKGLYIHGGFGVGKSHLMGAATTVLRDRGIGVIMVYVPDYFRELKEAIQSNEVGDKVKALQEVPVLILDDIGAENLTAWTRDDILGSILQYRANHHLPTCYTSNYSQEELVDHLSDVGRGIETLKALRIMERIKRFTNSYCIQDVNRRKLQSDTE
jgi:primosomal protein DnaI